MAAPTTLEELYTRTRDFAAAHSGAATCRVLVVLPEVTDDEDGVYWPAKQTIGLNPTTVIPWLERLLRGDVGSTDEAHSVLNSIVAMYHEHIHALGPTLLGPTYGRSIYRQGPKSQGAVDFENGVTELWARTTLTSLIHAVGIDELLNYPPDYESQTYVLEMLAVAAIIDKIAEIAHTSETEILRLMASHVPDSRGAALAEFVVDHRGTPDDKRPQVAAAFESAFWEIQLVEDILSEDYPGWARTLLWASVVEAEST